MAPLDINKSEGYYNYTMDENKRITVFCRTVERYHINRNKLVFLDTIITQQLTR